MGRSKFFIRMKFEGLEVRKIAFGSISNQGARHYQEDSFGFSSFEKGNVKKYGFAAVVADGMGGLSNGDKVIFYVVSAMLEMIKSRSRCSAYCRAIALAVYAKDEGDNVVVPEITAETEAVTEETLIETSPEVDSDEEMAEKEPESETPPEADSDEEESKEYPEAELETAAE